MKEKPNALLRKRGQGMRLEIHVPLLEKGTASYSSTEKDGICNMFKNTQKLKRAIPIMLMATITSFAAPIMPAEAGARLGDDVYITAEFKDTPVTDTLDALSRLSDIPIVISGKLKDTVTINANGQTLTSVLDSICRAFDLTYTERDGIIVVSDKDSDDNKEVKTFNVNYLDLDTLKEQAKSFVSDDKDVVIDKTANTITVTGGPAQIQHMENILKENDVKPKQVSLQAKFVELSKSDLKKYGVSFSNSNWGTYATDTPWKFVYAANMNLKGNDDTGKVIARPTVSTINGKEATINLSDRVPYLTTTTSNNDTTTTVTYQDVGVKLIVTPRVSDDGTVTMTLNPSVSTITSWTSNNNVQAPNIATREVTTNVRCKSGDTIIIGGLLKREDIKSIEKLPFLGNLPILGKLFQYADHKRDDTELVVMVTPVVEGMEDSDADTSKFLKEESRPQNLHNQDSIDHALHTDRRGEDNKKTGRL